MALSVQFEKQLGAFRLNVSFEAEGTLGILGASGCGKSVTLQCIAGILRPDRGRIVLNGRVLFDSEQRVNLPPQKRSVGYLFQQYALFPNMTVAQNIMAGVRAGSRAEKRRITEEALHTFHLADVSRQYPKTLSGGQQQRTALARIMVSKPELLLLDEPFTALDSYLKGQLVLELQTALDAFSGDVLFVSHDRDEVRQFCPNVTVLDGGRSEPPVPFDSLLNAPRSVAAARLAGYRNILTAAQARQLLPALCIPSDAAFVCIPDAALTPAADGDPDALRLIRFGTLFENGRRMQLLRPNTDNSAFLCMQYADSVDYSSGSDVAIRVNEKALFCFR